MDSEADGSSRFGRSGALDVGDTFRFGKVWGPNVGNSRLQIVGGDSFMC